MARTTETYQEAVARERIVSRTCDWCGQDMPFPKNGTLWGTDRSYYGGGWSTRYWELKYTKGENYPETSWANGWEVQDLCDPCIERLRQLLLDAGIRLTEVEEHS